MQFSFGKAAKGTGLSDKAMANPERRTITSIDFIVVVVIGVVFVVVVFVVVFVIVVVAVAVVLAIVDVLSFSL